MTTVRELFFQLYAYVLVVEQTVLMGEGQPSYEDVRGRMTTWLDEQVAAAKRQGLPDQDYDNARFAFIAWADEVLMGLTSWTYQRQWSSEPLQLTYYQTRNAGEELFERLESLRAEQHDVREIYYLCLGLGFTGRYFLGQEDTQQLNRIRHEQTQHLSHPVEALPTIAQLTPQPYAVTPPPRQPIKPPLTALLLKGGIALLVIVPLVLFLVYMLTPDLIPTVQLTILKEGAGKGSVQSTPSGIDCGATCKHTFTEKTAVQLHATPAPGSVFTGWQGDPACLTGTVTLDMRLTCRAVFALESLQPKVQEVLAAQQQSCTVLTVAGVQGGVVTLAGYMAEDTRQNTMRQAVLDIPGVNTVDVAGVRILPLHLCEVVKLLTPFSTSVQTQQSGLTQALNKGRNPTYVQGENVIVAVQTPRTFASHVYVDYYTADRSVGHLLPNPKEPTHAFAPQRTVEVGRLGGPQEWQVFPPFGLELITVIASPTPLFAPPRLVPESANDYLPVLRQALARHASSGIVASFQFLTTTAQP